VGQIACFLVLPFAVHNAVAVAPLLFLSSAFGFGLSTPIQMRVLRGAREAPRLAATLVSTAYNVGIAAGAAVGAALLTAGVSYALLPVTGAVCSTLGLGTALVSLHLSRKAAA
jgi:DHA1 family inner membrane transport protein